MAFKKFFGKKKEDPKDKIVRIGNYDLHANHGHRIEEYLIEYKYYSRNFPRMAKYIEDKYANFNILDIGANIGDSLSLLRSADVNQFVHLVEGDPVYLEYLHRNIKLFSEIKVHAVYLGEESKEENVTISNAEVRHISALVLGKIP